MRTATTVIEYSLGGDYFIRVHIILRLYAMLQYALPLQAVQP